MQEQTQQKPFSYIEGVAISNQLDRHGAALCVGDTVRIDNIVEDQIEYDNSWDSDMNKYVGSVGKILYIGDTGIKVEGTNNYSFPSTSLVLIRHVKENNQVEEPKAEPKPLRDVQHNQIILEWLTNPELVLEFKAPHSKDWKASSSQGCIHSFFSDYEYRLVKPKKFEKVYKYAFESETGNYIISISHFSEKKWGMHSKTIQVKNYTRLDWTVKEVEVE